MKRKLVIVYILMIAIGVVGLFSFGDDSGKNTTSEVPNQKKEDYVEIKKAVAINNLTKGEIIGKDDYKIVIEKVNKDKAVKDLNENPENIISWAVKNNISKGQILSVSNGELVRPGTQEYYELFSNPGSIIYTFSINKTDNFLLDNVKPGSGIDIYLVYGFETRGDYSREELISPPSAVKRRGMKRLIQNKKILGINKAVKEEKNGVINIAAGSQIVVELNEKDIKILKTLEMNTQLILLPTSEKEISNDSINIDEYLPVYDSNELDAQFSLPDVTIPEMQEKIMSTGGVNELRG
ncbi:hypothetical protein ACHEKC_000323 [Salmonella enterica subsp. enterica serovar Newport]